MLGGGAGGCLFGCLFGGVFGGGVRGLAVRVFLAVESARHQFGLFERSGLLSFQGESVARVLELAAETLERDGWCQGYGRLGGRRCALSAVSYASYNLRLYEFGPSGTLTSHAVSALRGYLVMEGLIEADGVGYIGGWNDSPDRQLTDVLSAMRKAAITARETVAT